MYFIYIISINIFGCLLLSQVGELKADFLTLQLWSSSATKMVRLPSQRNVGLEQYFYSYTYLAREHNDVVNIRCEANNSLTDPVLMWRISKVNSTGNISHVPCEEEHARELNYVTNLNEMHKGNNLTCVQYNATGSVVASAQVSFLCPTCRANETNFDAKCFNKSEITIYVNGELKRGSKVDVQARKDEVLTVHCLIEIDDHHTVGWDLTKIPNTSFLHSFSKSVVVFKGTMSDFLDNQTISCEKRRDGGLVVESAVSVNFKLKSNHYIAIEQSGSIWNTYREFTELPYNINDTIKLTCYWTHKMVRRKNMKWVKGGIEANTTKNSDNPVYKAILTEQDDGSNVTCENKILDVTHTKTICFRYVTPVENITDEKGNIVLKDQITHSDGQSGHGIEMEDVIWIVIGIIAVIVLVVIIVFVTRKYKTWRATAPKMNEISYINFQNMYTAPVALERPVLEPTYAGPVDDVNIYAYTYNQKPTQETYSTPFVPTIEEMYTQPIPKSTKERVDPTSPLPGKFSYANLQPGRQNQQEPGYSYVSRDIGDDVSETYTTATLYSRPR